MSCHGCRVLRKRCGENCVLRHCLDGIESLEAQGRATLFVSKFFGRNDLINFISAVPSHKRNALFQSLLFEAVGRTVNPVNGAIGLLSSGNWHLCQAAVRTVLAGGTPAILVNNSRIPETDGGAWSTLTIGNQIALGKCSIANAPPPIASFATEGERSYSAMPASNVSVNFQCSDGEDPKLLNLFV